ncbi:phosphoesterase PA-phosphatase [Actinoplanes sp. TFC3]|uniref:phosphatase PAP2 family protein n=1 Tax=Actinoplanes sp. TFC3 TaxID=1710355 RepID=UPI00082FF9F8|nr:phosphoesterase PA-phosphatase [Actinoplanes sp. TFC3]
MTTQTSSPARLRVAQLVTDVLSPAVLVAGLLLAVAWHAVEDPMQALLLGLVAAAAGSFIPISYILRGVRRGRWTDRHVTVREHRKLPILVCLVSTLAGTVLLALLGAPRELVALIASMMASLVVAWPVTVILRWKVSVHALVAAGAVGALGVVFGPALWLAFPLAVAVCWSRVVLRDHTVGQVVVGAAIGVVATCLLFPALY